MNGLHKDSICFYEYYLKIPDYRVPKSCKLVDSVWSTVFDVFACLLAGDDEEVYWCCGRLADRSIVVMDGAGRYYHVEKGKRKRYIAANLPEPGEQDFDTAVKKLKEEAGQRAEETDRQKRRNEEAKRRKRLEEIRDALPYRMGMKWGLKLGERIIVPPKYRKILPPVGVYCAFERLPVGGDGTGRESDGGSPLPGGGYRKQRHGTPDRHSRQSEDRQTVSVSGMKHK